MAADPEASVLRVAARLGLEDPTAVRRLLAAWWAWAGSLTARGELADSDVFLAQRDAEGLLELPLDVAARAIEFELADLHGLGAARRAARAVNTRPRSEPGDSGAPSPAAAPAASLAAAPAPSAAPPPAPSPVPSRPPSPALVGTVAFGTLFILVAGGIGLAQVVHHVPLPGGSASPSTAPYRAWIGILAGVGGMLGALIAMRLRPTTADALRLARDRPGGPRSLLAGPARRRHMARVGGGGAVRGRGRRRLAPNPHDRPDVTRQADGRRRAGDPVELARRVLGGDRRAVARAISLLEDSDPRGAELMALVFPHTGRAAHIGLTGPPGSGKSTLISALCGHLRTLGLTVGVLSVDPTSPFTRGALLGDRIRLAEHYVDPGVYIRSMGTRGTLGGVAEATLQAGLVIDASGRDVVLYETVGVGQSEVAIATLADVVALVLMPGSGDSIQALKAGIMEIPDLVVLNKSDLPAASAARSELEQVLRLAEPERRPGLVETSALDRRRYRGDVAGDRRAARRRSSARVRSQSGGG